MSNDTAPLSYRDAGVDIDTGNKLVERIKPMAAATHRPGVLGAIGGFSGLFEVPVDRYRNPVLVSGTDGVGTKLKLANRFDRHDTIGIDLVAMCVNDIVVTGAEPLFFLDYIATGRLDVTTTATVVAGIADGCRQAGAALLGGETAEMPGIYQGGDYDLAGFCVGVVEKERIIDGNRVKPGDALVGIASSGPHSNGYSLIRKVLERSRADPESALGESTLGQALLAPTRIYVKAIHELIAQMPVHAICHVTGGGITENVPRVLPKGTRAVIELGSWIRQPIFDWIQGNGNVPAAEMLRTFNCGVGMIVCVSGERAAQAVDALSAGGETAHVIGRVIGATGAPRVEFTE